MKATLISGSARSLDELRRRVQAEGGEVAVALERKPREPLRELLARSQGDLLVVECADDGCAADLPALEELSRVQPQLPILLLAPRLDSDQLIAAMRAGVREVLPAPHAAADFTAALRRIAQRAGAQGHAEPPHGRVIAFLPCKGGSGSTFLATNVAYCLASEYGKHVALLDLDLQYGDAAYFVSDGRARSNLADLAHQVDRLDASLLDASMIDIAPGFKLLPAPEEPEAALSITDFQIGRVIDVAHASYDFVVLDAARMLDPLTIKGIDRADAVFLVTENMVPHMRDARRLVRILHALGYSSDKLHLVVNSYDRHRGIDLERLEEVVGVKVSHVVRDGGNEVAEAVNTGVPLVQAHPGSAVSRALREIAASLVEEPIHRNWLGRLVGHEA